MKFQLAKRSVARAHEMMTNGVSAAAGRKPPEWKKKSETIVGGIRTDMDGTAYW